MGENRTWSLANGQGGTKERIKKKEGRCKECGSLQGARKGNWELRGRGRLYSAKEGVRLHALPHRPRNGRSASRGRSQFCITQQPSKGVPPCNVFYYAACRQLLRAIAGPWLTRFGGLLGLMRLLHSLMPSSRLGHATAVPPTSCCL